MVLFQVAEKFSKDLIKTIFGFEKVKTDNTVFRLHYKLSVWLVWLYSMCYMYVLVFDHPLICMPSKYVDKKTSSGIGGYKDEINEFCWAHGTYTVTNLRPDQEIFPGIGTVRGDKDSVRYQFYYKWMYNYIITMMVVLLMPRKFWRSIENGRMKALVQKLKCILFSKNADEDIKKEKELLADYLYCHAGYHRTYAFGFVVAEFLNIMVALFLVLMWDSITDNEFSMHGTASVGAILTPRRLRTDRLARVFPVLGKCTFYSFGAGGDAQPNDFICALPLNVIHERAAVFFWYYFMLLLFVDICAWAFRIALIGSKRLRLFVLSGLTPLTPLQDLEAVLKNCTYSDWFVIYQIGLSVQPFLFREIIQQLVRKSKSAMKVRYPKRMPNRVALPAFV